MDCIAISEVMVIAPICIRRMFDVLNAGVEAPFQGPTRPWLCPTGPTQGRHDAKAERRLDRATNHGAPLANRN